MVSVESIKVANHDWWIDDCEKWETNICIRDFRSSRFLQKIPIGKIPHMVWSYQNTLFKVQEDLIERASYQINEGGLKEKEEEGEEVSFESFNLNFEGP